MGSPGGGTRQVEVFSVVCHSPEGGLLLWVDVIDGVLVPSLHLLPRFPWKGGVTRQEGLGLSPRSCCLPFPVGPQVVPYYPAEAAHPQLVYI